MAKAKPWNDFPATIAPPAGQGSGGSGPLFAVERPDQCSHARERNRRGDHPGGVEGHPPVSDRPADENALHENECPKCRHEPTHAVRSDLFADPVTTVHGNNVPAVAPGYCAPLANTAAEFADIG